MKNVITCLSLFLCMIFITATRGNTQLTPAAIDAVKLTITDIPEGYMYGTVPEPYKKTLKENPWMMDKAAIKRLADKIYPGGDFKKIADIHVTIIANKDTPFGDDIVCYLILYNSARDAQNEMKKVTEFAYYNSDRALLLTKDNLAVFLFVDDMNNFHFIQDLAKTIEERLKNL
ncbi:MAG: hypothetical protein A2176_11730 [Spirochaetes bacterium RBG_13_51_14]|nr:MAG: hypothetical protein A2176_11730 [Spirochaetes bacterium RBG_13_51_14]